MHRLLHACSFSRSFSTAALPTAHNFSFGACGFLISYHLGVAQGLQDAGFILASSKFAGASGGAIVALSLAANASMNDIQEEVKAMTRLCHSHGTIWRLEKRLRATFHAKFGNLPVEKLTQRLTIATEKMWPWRALVLTDTFRSTDDLCDALIASCYVPWYLARRGTSVFRGEYHVDGGLITLVPKVPGYTKLARFALFPPRIEVLDQLFESGKRSARIWAAQAGENDMKGKQ
ncbi:unnamed protein product [Peronospora belbahrii]|uniref:PNPLA domain-containing protein n=1 Tax=Peronospora belbahrii TaxID=622444 RepID=A0ABN8D4F7_9STRA|nr:unnamed protein product [Peronospora belbahrii]